jgi:sugar O-acyltransferase (sialic acid O-acetyltransferase NeuD family)
MKNNIIIIGSSGHAKVIIDIIEKENRYSIIGLVDNNRKTGEETLGYKIIGKDRNIPTLMKKHSLAGGIIAIGDNWIRKQVSDKIKAIAPSFRFITAIHPNAQIGKNVQIGDGTAIMAGVIINPDSRVGRHCILNTNSSLDHDCNLSDFSSLAPNVTTGGNVKIGKYSAVSLGANIIHGITINEHAIIGAGAVVIKDVPKLCINYGVPSKVMRTREIGEKYL